MATESINLFIVSQIVHWLNTPTNSYLGSGYGIDLYSELQKPLSEFSSDRIIAKMYEDIPILSGLGRGYVNIYAADNGIDDVKIFINVGGSQASGRLGGGYLGGIDIDLYALAQTGARGVISRRNAYMERMREGAKKVEQEVVKQLVQDITTDGLFIYQPFERLILARQSSSMPEFNAARLGNMFRQAGASFSERWGDGDDIRPETMSFSFTAKPNTKYSFMYLAIPTDIELQPLNKQTIELVKAKYMLLINKARRNDGGYEGLTLYPVRVRTAGGVMVDGVYTYDLHYNPTSNQTGNVYDWRLKSNNSMSGGLSYYNGWDIPNEYSEIYGGRGVAVTNKDELHEAFKKIALYNLGKIYPDNVVSPEFAAWVKKNAEDKAKYENGAFPFPVSVISSPSDGEQAGIADYIEKTVMRFDAPIDGALTSFFSNKQKTFPYPINLGGIKFAQMHGGVLENKGSKKRKIEFDLAKRIVDRLRIMEGELKPHEFEFLAYRYDDNLNVLRTPLGATDFMFWNLGYFAEPPLFNVKETPNKQERSDLSITRYAVDMRKSPYGILYSRPFDDWYAKTSKSHELTLSFAFFANANTLKLINLATDWTVISLYAANTEKDPMKEANEKPVFKIMLSGVNGRSGLSLVNGNGEAVCVLPHTDMNLREGWNYVSLRVKGSIAQLTVNNGKDLHSINATHESINSLTTDAQSPSVFMMIRGDKDILMGKQIGLPCMIDELRVYDRWLSDDDLMPIIGKK